MLLPLGLGTKTPKTPWMTISLVLLTMVFSFYSFQDQKTLKSDINLIETRLKIPQLKSQLKQEYCSLKRQAVTLICHSKLKKESDQLFEKTLHNKPRALIELDSYPPLKLALEQRKKELSKLYLDKGFLSQKTITGISLLKAQFSHANLLHLISNILFLFLFGRYVEAAVGPLIFSSIYFLGGFFGLGVGAYYFLPPGILLLGASANVFALLGSFYILFYHHYIKFLVAYFVMFRTILLPVKFTIPVLYILTEVAGQLSGISHIAHFSHLLGLLIGILCALLFLPFRKVSWPFIYPEEKEIFDRVKKNESYGQLRAPLGQVLKLNPCNYLAREKLIDSLLGHLFSHQKLLKEDYAVLSSTFEQVVGRAINNKDFSKAYKYLQALPVEVPLASLTKTFNQQYLIRLGDYALKQNDVFSAIRVYHVFLKRFPNSRVIPDLLKTAKVAILRLDHQKYGPALRALVAMDSQNNPLHEIIFRHLD